MERFFDAGQLERLQQVLDVTSLEPLHLPLRGADDIEVLITGWGASPLTEEILDSLPSLKAILHSAGTVKTFLIADAWARGIRVTSAAAANALPVAEYTLAAILFAGKGVFDIAERYRDDPNADADGPLFARAGNYHRTVGIIGASQIGRRVIELLGPFDIEIVLYDPYVVSGDPILEAARLVSLEALFRSSDVVSIHAPALPATEGLVSEAMLALLRPGAALINTARSSLVDQDALIRAAAEGRITAVLDVTDPEPVPLDHPLRTTRGIVLTPHVAGAKGNELHRLGEAVIAEASAFVGGRTPLHPVLRSSLITGA